MMSFGRHSPKCSRARWKVSGSNISFAELTELRGLAKVYGVMTEMQVQHLLDTEEFVEIHHE